MGALWKYPALRLVVAWGINYRWGRKSTHESRATPLLIDLWPISAYPTNSF